MIIKFVIRMFVSMMMMMMMMMITLMIESRKSIMMSSVIRYFIMT